MTKEWGGVDAKGTFPCFERLMALHALRHIRQNRACREAIAQRCGD